MCIFTISLLIFDFIQTCNAASNMSVVFVLVDLFMFSLFKLLLWTSSLVNVCCDGIFHRCSAWALSLQLWSLWGFFTKKKTLWNFKTSLKGVICGRGTHVSLLLLMLKFALIWTKLIFWSLRSKFWWFYF